MTQIKVSVIVPNFNHRLYLKDRIESILNQSFEDYELILLDDCSIDHSQDILQSYAQHPKVSHVILNKTNSGSPFQQWKKGIEIAKGEYIWIAESDDWAEHHFLEKMMNIFNQDETIVLSYCQSYNITHEGKIISTRDYWTKELDPERWKNPFIADGIEEIRQYMVHKNTIPNASAVVFKKSAFGDIPEIVYGMRMSGDWVIWSQILRHGNIGFIPDVLNYFRESPRNTRKHNTLEKKRLRVLEGLIQLNSIADILPAGIYHQKQELHLNKWVSLFSLRSLTANFFNIKKYVRVSYVTLLYLFLKRYLQRF